jgi:hypothetical protein
VASKISCMEINFTQYSFAGQSAFGARCLR